MRWGEREEEEEWREEEEEWREDEAEEKAEGGTVS